MVDAISDAVSDYGLDYFERISETVGEYVQASGILQKIEIWTGIPGHFIITGVTICALILFILNSGPFFILNILIALYPAYKSFKCLEAKDKDKCFKWMKFWIVFAAFHGAENLGNCMVWWMPGYGIMKFVFLVWCCIPGKHNGSAVIYDNYIHPIFSNNAETVDRLIKIVHDTYRRFV